MNEIPQHVTELIDKIVAGLPEEHKVPAKVALIENWELSGGVISTIYRHNGFGYHARFDRRDWPSPRIEAGSNPLDVEIPENSRIIGSMLVTVAESRAVVEIL